MHFWSLCQSWLALPTAFLWLAFAVAVVESFVTILAKLASLSARPKPAEDDAGHAGMVANPEAWAKLVDAFRGLLEGLTKLPAWVAIFLAGMALLWLVGEYPQLCE